VRFLHLADIHLGNQQYNLKERYNDFGRAFADAITLALDRGVDAVVIAGDLFHKAAVEPLTLLQAEDSLQRLKDAGVPVIAVHGNHDRARYLAQISWLDYLCERDLLCLLAPDFQESGVALAPWDAGAQQGAYLDVGHVRFVGVPWLGASAPHVLSEVAGVLPDLPASGITFTVLVTHAGLEGQMPSMPGGLTFGQIAPLKDAVQYLALGHLHKPYAVDGWIYNPGSLETCSFDEMKYERGAYLVEVSGAGTHQAEHLPNVRRPFVSIEVKTDLYATPEALHDAVLAAIRAEKRDLAGRLRKFPDPERKQPVARLILTGNLSFDRSRLDLEEMRRMLLAEIGAFPPDRASSIRSMGVEARADASLTRAELERAVFSSLIQSDSRFSGRVPEMTDLMQEIKTMALERAEPAAIYELLDAQLRRMEESSDVDH